MGGFGEVSDIPSESGSASADAAAESAEPSSESSAEGAAELVEPAETASTTEGGGWVETEEDLDVGEAFAARHEGYLEDDGDWGGDDGELAGEFRAAASGGESPEVDIEAVAEAGGSVDEGATKDSRPETSDSPAETVTEAFNEAAAPPPDEADGEGGGSEDGGGEGGGGEAATPAEASPEGLTDTFNAAAAARTVEQADPPPEQNYEREDWNPPPMPRGPMP